jgi:hypothetical protein
MFAQNPTSAAPAEEAEGETGQTPRLTPFPLGPYRQQDHSRAPTKDSGHVERDFEAFAPKAKHYCRPRDSRARNPIRVGFIATG